MARAAPRRRSRRRAGDRRRAEALGRGDSRGGRLGAVRSTSRWAAPRPLARCCGSTSRTGSTAPGARGRNRITPHASSSARTAPRPSPRRRPTGGSSAEFFAEHSIEELAERSDYWLGQQGRLTEPMYRAPGSRSLPADLVGRCDRRRRRPPPIARLARSRRVLHVGAHEQRGRLPLPAVRQGLRHEQPP